jgi:hypothetical protein
MLAGPLAGIHAHPPAPTSRARTINPNAMRKNRTVPMPREPRTLTMTVRGLKRIWEPTM